MINTQHKYVKSVYVCPQPMSSNSNFARVFLNQDAEVSSPQPQPIDDIAGIRVAPWDDSPPRAVQVVSRHRAIDLMPLLCRNLQERRCNPPFSDQNTQRYRHRGGVRFTPKRWYQLDDTDFYRTKMLDLCELLLLACSLQPQITFALVASKRAEPFEPGNSSLQGPRGKLGSN